MGLEVDRSRLEAFAQQLAPRVQWNDLILPEREMALLQQINDEMGHRSREELSEGSNRPVRRASGVLALFVGDEGTGKTMAAGVLASALRLDLYRVDLSRVVSKYIGETEKNLRRLFDAAQHCGIILFFDEADALFGKRSDVKDSHDRYANVEINYLLQQMETYRGLVILATNMKSAIDPAFLRLLHPIVTFPFPGVAARKRLWQGVFPSTSENAETANVAIGDLDFDRLASLALTGGQIRNVARAAADLAAKAGTAVSMSLVLAAVDRLELPRNR